MTTSLLPPWVPNWLVVSWLAVVGASVGSFLNVIIVRWPAGQSVVKPRSRCPGCQELIRWYDNIPILSFLWLRGKCRRCGARISYRYPLVELLMLCLTLALWARFGVSWTFVLWFPLAAALVAITFLDLDEWWVPDLLTFPSMAWAFGLSFAPGGLTPVESLLGLLPAAFAWGVAFLFKVIRGKEGLALGDIKLLAVIGLAMGAWAGMTVLLWASIQGAVVGSLVALTGGHRRLASEVEPPAPEAAPLPEGEDEDEEVWVPPPGAFPFGPLLVLATFEVLLLPEWFGILLPQVSAWIQQLVQ